MPVVLLEALFSIGSALTAVFTALVAIRQLLAVRHAEQQLKSVQFDAVEVERLLAELNRAEETGKAEISNVIDRSDTKVAKGIAALKPADKKRVVRFLATPSNSARRRFLQSLLTHSAT